MVDLGGLTLEAIETPGHTPEHLAYLLRDAGRPVALFSGGSLLVGAVARTDLVAPEATEDLARSLWRSIRERLLCLPDDLPVYPTHGAGSFCSVAPGGERVTTIGRERATNPLLGAPDETAFVARLLAGFGTFPPYFLELRDVNRRGPKVYGEFPVLAPLGAAAVERLCDGGAAMVDVRPVEAFAAGHIPGSLSIPMRPQFASWLGWLVDRDRPLVFVAGAGQDRDELVRQCLAIGYERLGGELAGGVDAWQAGGRPVRRVPLVRPDEELGIVVDVRQRNEFAAGHVAGALNLELGEASALASTLPAGRLTVMCGHGERAMSAASVLAAQGRADVSVLVGGPADVASARGERLVV
jgi:rhodanese-related sulfurtransferase